MKNISSIFKKEIKVFFNTYMASLILGGTAFLNALFVLISNFHERNNYEDAAIITMVSFMSTIIIASMILAMSSIVEEKNKGTMELLYTSPITDAEIVIGKFLFGAFICLIITLFINGLYTFFLFTYWKAPAYLIVSGSVGIFLLGCFTYSVGMFGSSLGKNQMISLLVGVLIILTLWVVGFFSHLFQSKARAILFHLHIFSHYISFSRGVLPLSGIVFFLSGIFTFLYLTIKSLESRRWLG